MLSNRMKDKGMNYTLAKAKHVFAGYSHNYLIKKYIEDRVKKVFYRRIAGVESEDVFFMDKYQVTWKTNQQLVGQMFKHYVTLIGEGEIYNELKEKATENLRRLAL